MSESKNNAPVVTEFSIDISDPWTIASITLLGILLIVSFYRTYMVLCNKKRIKTGVTKEAVSVKDEKKNKTFYKTRADMLRR